MCYRQWKKFRCKKICIYTVDEYSQAYWKTALCFRHLAKHNILETYITQKGFVTSYKYPQNDRPCYKIYVSDIRHPQIINSAQLIKGKFVFRPALEAARNSTGNAFRKTKKILTIGSDGHRQFDFFNYICFIT